MIELHFPVEQPRQRSVKEAVLEIDHLQQIDMCDPQKAVHVSAGLDEDYWMKLDATHADWRNWLIEMRYLPGTQSGLVEYLAVIETGVLVVEALAFPSVSPSD